MQDSGSPRAEFDTCVDLYFKFPLETVDHLGIMGYSFQRTTIWVTLLI